MGRKPSRNLNLPRGMRARHRKAATFYYLDTGAKPRKEIALGSDYFAALRKYAELRIDEAAIVPTFADLSRKYIVDALPNLADSTQATQKSDLKHLDKFFGEPPAPLHEIKPMHIHQMLQWLSHSPTTANRCKRLFSTMWNKARAWGYIDLPNPCEGIKGHALGKREVYITDAVFTAVRNAASEPLRDALDLAYLTGQRPADALKMTAQNVADGYLEIDQGKTKKKLRISITGELATLLGKITVRKAQHKIIHNQLLMNRDGMPLTKAVLRKHFVKARDAAALKSPELAGAIKEFWFYDLRAKAADDTADDRGEQAASDLLGHDSIRTTQKHYLRRGKMVSPTK